MFLCMSGVLKSPPCRRCASAFMSTARSGRWRCPQLGNFTLAYETSIPRQAGLSGSSAIVCAALNCLLDFYGVASQCVGPLCPAPHRLALGCSCHSLFCFIRTDSGACKHALAAKGVLTRWELPMQDTSTGAPRVGAERGG